MPKIIGMTIKATIINIIVALIITATFFICIYLFAGAQIANAISAVNLVSINIKEEQKEEKEAVIDKETNLLQNFPDYGIQYATIEIPKIDVNLPVYYGDTLDILKKGVGHSSGSYFPGEGGSIIYMGHNSANVFRRFSELQKGNEIIIKTAYGEFKYKIYDMQLIQETDVYKLPIKREKEVLMVYTCYPFNNIGYTTQRYVVYADLEK